MKWKGSESSGGTQRKQSDIHMKASNLAGEAGKFIEKNLESAAVADDMVIYNKSQISQILVV